MMMRQSTGRSLGSRWFTGECLVVMPNQAVETQGAMGSGTELGRRPTVVPAPIAANPENSDRPRRRTITAPEKHTHSQRGRPSRRHRRNRCDPAPSWAIFVGFGLVAPSAVGGNPGRHDSGVAWAEIAPSQSAGHITGQCTKRKRPAPAPSGAGRGNHHRSPKNLPIYWESQLAPIAPEIVRDNTP